MTLSVPSLQIIGFFSIIFLLLIGLASFNEGKSAGKSAEFRERSKRINAAFGQGHSIAKAEKANIYINLGPSEFMLHALHDEVKTNLFSAEYRRN